MALMLHLFPKSSTSGSGHLNYTNIRILILVNDLSSTTAMSTYSNFYLQVAKKVLLDCFFVLFCFVFFFFGGGGGKGYRQPKP